MQPIDIYISYLGINDWYCVLIYNLSYFYLWLLKIILHKPINGWLIFTCFMYLCWYSCTMHLHAYMCRTCRQLSEKLEMGFGYPENGVRDGCEALMWVLGTESGSSARASSTLNCDPSLWALDIQMDQYHFPKKVHVFFMMTLELFLLIFIPVIHTALCFVLLLTLTLVFLRSRFLKHTILGWKSIESIICIEAFQMCLWKWSPSAWENEYAYQITASLILKTIMFQLHLFKGSTMSV